MPAARPCRDPRCALGGSTPTERSPIAGHRPRSASAAIFVPRWARANRADVDRARVAALDASSIERPRRHFGSPRANPSQPPHLSIYLSLSRARARVRAPIAPTPAERASSNLAAIVETLLHRARALRMIARAAFGRRLGRLVARSPVPSPCPSPSPSLFSPNPISPTNSADVDRDRIATFDTSSIEKQIKHKIITLHLSPSRNPSPLPIHLPPPRLTLI